MTFAGVLGYKYFFFKSSWRNIYLYSTLLTAFFSLLQLVLVFQINIKYLNLNNYFFSLGDDVITAYISGIQFLPVRFTYIYMFTCIHAYVYICIYVYIWKYFDSSCIHAYVHICIYVYMCKYFDSIIIPFH
jgi:hypothetical protein